VLSTEDLLKKGPMDFLRENAAPGYGGGPKEMSPEEKESFGRHLNSLCTNGKVLVDHLGECFINKKCGGIDANIYVTCEGTLSLLTRFQDTNRNEYNTIVK